MNKIQPGRWAIESIMINTTTVMNFEGFEYLEVEEGKISIQPIGIQFAVTESNQRRAVLLSRGRVFLIEFEVQGNELKMTMTRPKFSDTFQVTAQLQESLVDVN